MAAVLARMNDGVLMVDNMGNVQLLNSAAERCSESKKLMRWGIRLLKCKTASAF
jgi:signal transduction histidine kinase